MERDVLKKKYKKIPLHIDWLRIMTARIPHIVYYYAVNITAAATMNPIN